MPCRSSSRRVRVRQNSSRQRALQNRGARPLLLGLKATSAEHAGFMHRAEVGSADAKLDDPAPLGADILGGPFVCVEGDLHAST